MKFYPDITVPTPAVGDKMTFIIGSDRYVHTVKSVISAQRVALGDGEDSVVVSLRKDGKWRRAGTTQRGGYYVVGDKGEYRDPSF